MHILKLNLLDLSLAFQTKQFKGGDKVLVKNDKNLVKELQVGHGGWNETMVSVSFFICFLSLK